MSRLAMAALALGWAASPKIITLDDWRKWAKKAEVLNAAH